MTTPRTHQIVIIGGGAAGTSVAASLLNKRPSLDVAVIEPADTYYYQPAFTLVGCGTYNELECDPRVERNPRTQRGLQ